MFFLKVKLNNSLKEPTKAQVVPKVTEKFIQSPKLHTIKDKNAKFFFFKLYLV